MQESIAAPDDTVAEWSKAPGSGPGSKERGFKSHRCQRELQRTSIHEARTKRLVETFYHVILPLRPVR
jgi:hypothetical protein